MLPTDTTNQNQPTKSSANTATAMPNINSITASTTSTKNEDTTHAYLHTLFENALVYLSQSPLTTQNRRAGIAALFDLLNNAKLVTIPLLHAMTHTAIAINTMFDERNDCQYKLDHLEKAQDIVLSVMRDKHGREKEDGVGACQGCLYIRLQRDVGRELGEEVANECNSLARLSSVIERESLRVAEFNWGEMDHLLT